MPTPNLLQSVLKPRNSSSSPRRSVSSPKRNRRVSTPPDTTPQTCLCSPTTHPGSFRCRLHRASPQECSRHTRASESVITPIIKASPNQTSVIGGSTTLMKVQNDGGVARRTVPLSANTSSYLNTPRIMLSAARPSRLSRVVMAGDPEKGVFSPAGNATSAISDKKAFVMELSRRVAAVDVAPAAARTMVHKRTLCVTRA